MRTFFSFSGWAFARRLLPLLLLALLSAAAQAQFTYTTENGQITITRYDCSSGGGAVTIPGTINGLPVTSIGDWAFSGCTSLTSVTIPNSVTRIEWHAFAGCSSLTGAYFKSNPPSVENAWGFDSVFDNDSKVVVYYLLGTTGWTSTFSGRPTMLWKPEALPSDASFGVRAGQFGFTITWASDRVIVVEACADLANPV